MSLMKKRVIALLLSLVLVICAVPFAFAEDETEFVPEPSFYVSEESRLTGMGYYDLHDGDEIAVGELAGNRVLGMNLAEELGALLHGHLEDIVAGRHRQRGTEALYGLVSVSRDLNHVLRSGTRLGERIGCLLEQPELVGGGGVLENVLGFLGRRDRIIRFVLPVLAAGTST